MIDEIDHFQKGESQAGAEEVNTLLQEIERGRNKILFIGTTNELEVLPDSLIRDGRMGSVIHFEHCDKAAAKAIMKNLLNAKADIEAVARVLGDEALLDKLAKRCEGMVAASVAAIINDALSESIINKQEFEVALDNAVSTRKKKEIEKVLSQNSKCAGHRLNITEDSTMMYDTKFPRMLMAETDPENLDSLGGMEDVKQTLREEILEVYEPETIKMMQENKLPISKGFILYGPPGCGKTTIVKALANDMKIPLYAMSAGNIGSSYIHETSRQAKMFRDQLAYKFAQTGERSILFIDEAQQLIPRTSGSGIAHQHNIEEVNFFKEMLLTANQDGIIYAMATNDINQIEPAFYENSDRLGVKIYVGYPDEASRIGIIQKLLATRPIANLINNNEAIAQLAKLFEGDPISRISQGIMNTIRECIKLKIPVTLDKATETIMKLKR